MSRAGSIIYIVRVPFYYDYLPFRRITRYGAGSNDALMGEVIRM